MRDINGFDIENGVLRRYYGPGGDVVIPDGVTYIDSGAFIRYSSLTSVTIPDGVTSIGNGAFSGCSGLTSVTIPSSVTSIGNTAFDGCSSLTSVTIPSSVTSISAFAFSRCSSLTSVTIPSSVTSIDRDAFYGCSSLTSVTIPSSVTSIGTFAFGGCSSLTSVTIPEGVTSIGNAAFDSCSSLTSVTILEGVTGIGEFAFQICSSLTSVTIPSSVTYISEGAFVLCSSLTSVTIPEGVTGIGGSAFSGCSSLTSVTIPSSVTSISAFAFNSCSSLTSVTIPEGVTVIGEGAFGGCSSLTSVTIPSSVTGIDWYAFDGCTNLKEIYVNNYRSNVTFDNIEPWGATNAEVFWLDDLFEVQFMDWDGTSLLTEKVYRGRNAIPPVETPTRRGYFFKNWSDSYEDVQSDLMLYAIYDKDMRKRLRIEFDTQMAPLPIRMILATRSGSIIRELPINHVKFTDDLGNGSEIAFSVYKERCAARDGGVDEDFWKQIESMRLAYCPEFDLWYELKVDFTDSAETVKTVAARSLGEAELSQIRVYGMEINTEADIARDDYVPTVLYDGESPGNSLLDRLLYKAPHYTISYVDDSIRGLQRMFQFNDISIYDAFQEIAKEIGCLFRVYCSRDEEDGQNILREIYVYDLWSVCRDCGTRGEFTDTCDRCGGHDILPGYGVDTGVYVDKDNLAKEIVFSTDTGSVKNCFHLTAGDDLMTAAIVSCNPNGSQYLWYIPEYMQKDMSDELREKLAAYNGLYDYYQKEYTIASVAIKPDE